MTVTFVEMYSFMVQRKYIKTTKNERNILKRMSGK